MKKKWMQLLWKYQNKKEKLILKKNKMEEIKFFERKRIKNKPLLKKNIYHPQSFLKHTKKQQTSETIFFYETIFLTGSVSQIPFFVS